MSGNGIFYAIGWAIGKAVTGIFGIIIKLVNFIINKIKNSGSNKKEPIDWK